MVEPSYRSNMKKPNQYSLVLKLAPLAFVLMGGAVAATAPDAGLSSDVPAATTTNKGELALVVTPDVLSTTHRVIKINVARWLNGSRLVVPQANGEMKELVYDDYVADQKAHLADPKLPLSLTSLLDEDATVQIPIKQGESSVVIDIGAPRTVERFGFFSFSAVGSVDIYSSTSAQLLKIDDQAWESTNIHQAFGSRRIVNVDLKALNARLVKMVFKLNQSGAIGPLALFGSFEIKKPIAPPEQRNQDGSPKSVKPDDLVEFDYAQLAYGSKVSHVLGGDVNDAQNVLVSDPEKSLVLGALGTGTTPDAATVTNEKNKIKLENIFIVDMGAKRDINKVNLLFNTSGNGSFQFYFLSALPTKPKPTAALLDDYLHRGQPLLLASNTPLSVAEAMALAQDTPAPGPSAAPTVVDYLPADFFDTNKPAVSQNIAGSGDNTHISQVFDTSQNFRYALVRWIPETNNQPPVEIFRVNLIGKVSIQDFGKASSDIQLATFQANPTGGLPQTVVTGPTSTPVVVQSNPPPTSPPTPPTPPSDPPPPVTPNPTPPVSS